MHTKNVLPGTTGYTTHQLTLKQETDAFRIPKTTKSTSETDTTSTATSTMNYPTSLKMKKYMT